MNTSYHNLAIVIPSLDPSEALVPYIQALLDQGFDHIYIVNDGSDALYTPIFQTICTFKACTLLTHPYNRGKGAALKTAYYHLSKNFPQCRGIITADSDGQHAVKDVCQMADRLLTMHHGLILGGRNFSHGKVPLKSLIGNRISSLFFFLLHKTWVQDTQTGLRGFDISLLPEMLSIDGDRFEYEMAVLTTCTRKKVPIYFITIDTIYINGNVGSHFKPLADSLLIGKILLGGMARFLLSSCLSGLVDIALCCSFLYLFSNLISLQLVRIGLSVLLARTASILVNYTINKTYVFRTTNHSPSCLGRYLLLAMANMIALTILIYGGHSWLGIDERLVVVLVNIVLFLVNYQVQNSWVFPSTKLGGNA